MSSRKQRIKVGLIAGLAGIAMGLVFGSRIFEQAMQDKYQVDRQMADLQETVEAQRRELVNAQLAAKVDRMAAEEVRHELAGLQTRLKERNNELALFRNLLKSAGDIKQGLGIKELTLTRTAGGANYRLVIYQKESRMKTIKVQIAVQLVGELDGEPRVLSLGQLDENVDGENSAVKFKYFHVMTGTLQLPEGFKPSLVRVAIWPVGQTALKVEREFPWQLEISENKTRVDKR